MSKVPSKTLPLFNRFLARSMGLHFSAARLCELEQRMRAAAREFGYRELEPCMLWLMSEPLSREQVDTLARFLTIGETYFLRDAESYRVLEQEVLPELIRKRRKEGKRLSIWSAGCSSGEEPYSIAALLVKMIPDLDSWEIALHATDINPAALDKGRHGVYGNWSLRNTPPWLFHYLVRHGDGRHEVSPRVKKLVTFSRLNLAKDSFLSLFPQGKEADVIFCRNVMLYFHEDLKSEVAAKFHQVLRDGGWLFVSPTEADQRTFSSYSCRRFPGALVYRKGCAGEHEAAFPPFSLSLDPPKAAPSPPADGGAAVPRHPVTPAPVYQAPAAAGKEVRGKSAGEVLPSGGAPDAEALEKEARGYAGAGRLDEARVSCEAAIAADRLRPGSHYLLSIILEEQGLLKEAEASLKRALYLDQDFLIAHFALGNLDRQAGREQEARRHFRNALRLLEQLDGDEVLAEAAGLTAGRLAEMIRATL